MSLYEENAAVLRVHENQGSDLSLPRKVDFSLVFPDHSSAGAFSCEARLQGFVTTTEKVEQERDPWDVTASKEMVPSCSNITKAEEHLNSMAKNRGGRSDGWGFCST